PREDAPSQHARGAGRLSARFRYGRLLSSLESRGFVSFRRDCFRSARPVPDPPPAVAVVALLLFYVSGKLIHMIVNCEVRSSKFGRSQLRTSNLELRTSNVIHAR